MKQKKGTSSVVKGVNSWEIVLLCLIMIKEEKCVILGMINKVTNFEWFYEL